MVGDAYVDHPSFGAAIISRLLESQGYSVAMLPQPDWRSTKDIMRFGKPKLAFLVTGGNIDSMVAHYTAAKRKRSQDSYSPGGKAGLRPDRAVITYCQCIRRAYPDAVIAIGGLEASLRRFAHYDYWSDTVRPSILVESGADFLMYGMGEHSITEMAARLRDGEPISALTDIRGTCYLTDPVNTPWGAVQCPDFAQVASDKKAYAKATRQQYDQQDEIYGKTVIQRHGKQMLVQNPPALSLTQEELDAVYQLPFQRKPHPMYDAQGVGLAAPQVGVLKRIVVIDVSPEGDQPVILINPEIIEKSGEQTGYEGCLSVPGKTGIVTRANYCKVKALNENMEEIVVEGEELFARALQHEIAHLEGQLYVSLVEGELMNNSDLEEQD